MFRDDLLKDKRILVTGGGTGLGKSMARRFVELGAELVICGRRAEVLEDTVSEFNADHPGRASWRQCDVRDPQAVEAMVEALFAERPLDVLLNNAAGNFVARTETLSHRALDSVLGIVLHGTGYMTLACGKRWLALGHKAQVLSIIVSYAWMGSAYVVPSSMAKAGVLAMTRSLAVEWGGRGVRLNAIAPGPFPTEGAWSRLVPKKLENQSGMRAPLGRVGEHMELANLAAYLLADEAEYINGECVTIDGGAWLKGGAGSFSHLSELSDAEWDAMNPKKG